MKERAYTLIEVMIAMAIFACLAAICCQGLKILIVQKESLDVKAKLYYHLQKTQRQLQEDMELAVDFNGAGRAFMGDAHKISLWRLSHETSDLPRLSQIQYDFSKTDLQRQALNAAGSARKNKLLSNVEKLNFHYLDAEQNWHSTWPSASVYQAHLPRAIKIEMMLKNGESLSWILPILADNWQEEGEREYEKSLPR